MLPVDGSTGSQKRRPAAVDPGSGNRRRHSTDRSQPLSRAGDSESCVGVGRSQDETGRWSGSDGMREKGSENCEQHTCLPRQDNS